MVALARRVLAGVFAATWLYFPGFGLIDLTVTWNPEWPQVLEAGWGLYMTAFVGVPFVAVVIRATPPPAAAVQLYISATALVIAAIGAAEWALIIWGLAIAIETAIVTGNPRRWSPELRKGTCWLPMAALTLVGVGPAVAYAVRMWALNREDRFDKDITVGIDHYSVQGAFAIAVIALVACAAFWPAGRRFIAAFVGFSTSYLGLVSWAWHPTPGSVSHTWSILCMVWGASVAMLAFIPERRSSPSLR